MGGMTITETAPEAWIPEDTFGARLALVRISLGINITQAAEMCGISAESWRKWERGTSPRGMDRIARTISERTGANLTWLMVGGELSRNRCFSQVLDQGQMHLLELNDSGTWTAYNDRPQLEAVPVAV